MHSAVLVGISSSLTALVLNDRYYTFQYIKMRTQKISVLLKKRFAAPNWVKVIETIA